MTTAYAATRLARMLAMKPGEVREVRSSRWRQNGITYEMLCLPDGRVVHYSVGCEDELFRGPGSCRHSTDLEKYGMTSTTAIERYKPMTPVELSFSMKQLDIIRNALCRGASDGEIAMFVAVCERSGLDPFFKQIYPIMRRSREGDQWVDKMTIQVGIDGYRLIAERTGRYVGMDQVEYLTSDGEWTAYWMPASADDHPMMARTAVYVKGFAKPIPGVCRWDAYKYTTGNPPKLGAMWAKMPDVMLGKCAEALALRRAFPNELSPIFAMTGDKGVYDPQEDPAVSAEATEGEYREVTTDETPDNRGTGPGHVEPLHEEPQAEETGPPPAASPDFGKTSELQMRSIREWYPAVSGKHGAPVATATTAWLKARFPYCVDPTGQRANSLLLNYEDAQEYICMLIGVEGQKRGYDTEALTKGDFWEHNFQYDGDAVQAVCTRCKYPMPEEAEEPDADASGPV